MPENIDRKEKPNVKLSVRKVARSLRMLNWVKIAYRGAGLIKLRTLERKCDKAGRQLDGQPVLERIPALFTLVKTYDLIFDRRRILCGESLPRNAVGHPSRQIVDMLPEPIPEPIPEPVTPETVPAMPEQPPGVD